MTDFGNEPRTICEQSESSSISSFTDNTSSTGELSDDSHQSNYLTDASHARCHLQITLRSISSREAEMASLKAGIANLEAIKKELTEEVNDLHADLHVTRKENRLLEDRLSREKKKQISEESEKTRLQRSVNSLEVRKKLLESTPYVESPQKQPTDVKSTSRQKEKVAEHIRLVRNRGPVGRSKAA